MMATTYTGCVEGIRAMPIQVEVKVHNGGYPGFKIVGLAEGAVKESKVRVLAALSRCGYYFGEDSVTVNLAPADVRKSGSSYDLAIAVGLLIAKGVVPQEKAAGYLILGELSLHAGLRPVCGALPIALCAREQGKAGVILPRENAREAAVVPGIEVSPASSLPGVVDFLRGVECRCTPADASGDGSVKEGDHAAKGVATEGPPQPEPGGHRDQVEIADVRGQLAAKRALSIAAAGSHNLLMIGPPGAGKTMLARAFASILPPLSFEEAMETTAIYSVAGLLHNRGRLITARPFRAPHHTISYAGLIGGGFPPRPGEVSLAHNGVLFLDEFPEFSRYILDLLRQPLEEGEVTIARSWGSVRYPARFALLAAMNPCPCGHRGSPVAECRCSPEAVRRYASRISGPILDRIDMKVQVPYQSFKVIAGPKDTDTARKIMENVARARATQAERFAKMGIACHANSAMSGKVVEQVCELNREARAILEQAIDRFGLSARAYTRVRKVARTIADMEGETTIGAHHIKEALQFRLDTQI